MKRMGSVGIACLVLAAMLKTAQRICMPLVPAVGTVAYLLAEAVFFLVSLGVGLGAVACMLDLPGRRFATLYGRCAGIGLLCRMAALLVWQWLGWHWVLISFAGDAAVMFWCAWQIGGLARDWQKEGMTAVHDEASAQHRKRGLRLLGVSAALIATVWVQYIVWKSCCWFVEGSASYRAALDGLALPIGLAEGLLVLVCCWALLPSLPERNRKGKPLAVVELCLLVLMIGLGLLGGLIRPEGFLAGMSHAGRTSYHDVDRAMEKSWQTQMDCLQVMRRQEGSPTERENLRLMRVVDDHGRCAGWSMVTGPTIEEIFTWEGETVELIYPCGLLVSAGSGLRLIRLAALPKESQSDLLMAFCRKYLSDFRLFADCAGYLIRHDPGSVKAELERYAAGLFSQEEMAGDIRLEYVEKTAEKLLLCGE
ncbi:MAG: hypothetical protein J6K73_06610 [Clostridia bacterium]|nr:hypothetical protein [Clostridia bacterium]